MGLLNWLFSGSESRQFNIGGVNYVFARGGDDDDTITLDLLSLPSVANALDVKSNDVGQIPLYEYLRNDDGGRQRFRSQLDYRLSQQPNTYQTSFQFWKTATMQAILAESFILYRDGQLTLLPFGRTYRYTTPDGEVRFATMMTPDEAKKQGLNPAVMNMEIDYAYNEVLHLYASQDECGNPYPIRCRFRAVMGLGSHLYAYSYNVYGRGGLLAGYLSTDHTINDDQKIKIATGFKAMFKKSTVSKSVGSDIKISALDGGWKFVRLDLTPQEAMLLEAKADFTRDVAKIFNLPLWKLGVLTDYKYASAEQASTDYLTSSLNPLLVQIEREANAKLLTDFERQMGVYIEFNREKLITLDTQTMASVDDLAVKNGGMSINEWRARRNLPAVPGGDMRQVPVNVTSAAFVEQAEGLKLEGLKLSNDLKATQIAQAKATASSAEPATAPVESPAATPVAKQVVENSPESTNSQ